MLKQYFWLKEFLIWKVYNKIKCAEKRIKKTKHILFYSYFLKKIQQKYNDKG